MFDYGNANANQIEAINNTEGPVLIIAGPGTGKTFTLVQRAIYLISEKGIQPEEIMVATFTEKAAKELITRITNALLEIGMNVNVNDMYIGTFHSICLRLIKENLEFTRIKKNYRLLDQFDQQYTVFQNIRKFNTISNFDSLFNRLTGQWKRAATVCFYVNAITEELVDYEDLIDDSNMTINLIGEIMKTYQDLLNEQNLVDFSAIQVEAYNLLADNEQILEEIQAKIKYLMIDEYQDTNYVQEQIAFLVAGDKKNICVVGDDDQGLYRFRGATIRNILEFPGKFPQGQCKETHLTINYRSEKGIVDFYNKWMTTTTSRGFSFNWDRYRFPKTIIAGKKNQIESATVVKVSGVLTPEDWQEKVLAFIKELLATGKLKDLNQIAFLFKSVKNEHVKALADFLESNGINVYSPRSGMFFDRLEISMLLGCLLLTFPDYYENLLDGEFPLVKPELIAYYTDCVYSIKNYLQKSGNRELKKWIEEKGELHSNLTRNADYGLAGLMYQVFAFEPFHSWLDTDLSGGVTDLRPARNIATLTEIVGKFEYLQRIEVLTTKNIKHVVEGFFNYYLMFLMGGGIFEYEDDSEYAPSGCVSFMTIHQAKGMEFPVVIVDSLGNTPRAENSNYIGLIEHKYFKRKTFEPYEDIKFFDFWRLYYTAFSRAQNLLVLSCFEKGGQGKQPSKYFDEIYANTPYHSDTSFKLKNYNFELIKDVNLKNTYSFTSHISVFENCALQYKFFKELGFTPIRVGATIYGMLIHQTLEDIHRTAIRKEENLITTENINFWFDTNYSAISKSERAYLGKPQLDAALEQVLKYVARQNGNWQVIQDTEVEVGLVKPDYILQGTIDLIKGVGNTVEIVDFKAEEKPNPDMEREKVEHYKRQLQVYAHLVEEKTGREVSKMHIYYTGDKTGDPQITFPKNKESISATIAQFDTVVKKIQNKDYSEKSKSKKLCDNCDLRHFCRK